MAAHWPGPLTLAVPARPGLPVGLVDEGCVAARESPHPLARALVAGLGRPITATSANRAGGPPARSAADVEAAFGPAAARFVPGGYLLLDGGETPGGAPSTLCRLRGEQVEVLRPGPVVVEAGFV
jgi:L-threonylcarbamoyladenylate synthase